MTTQDADKTPYDSIWTWLASAVLGFSVLVQLALSTGSPSLFPNASAVVQDDVKATIAFWGALVSGVGLAALGTLAFIFAGTTYSRPGLSWPRFTLFESERRVALVSRLSLAVILIIPLASVTGSMIAYVNKSRIARWDDATPLAPGFVSSRLAAVDTSCPREPCFRFAPKDGAEPFAQQWFVWSDPLAVAVLLGALIAWGAFGVRAARAGP